MKHHLVVVRHPVCWCYTGIDSIQKTVICGAKTHCREEDIYVRLMPSGVISLVSDPWKATPFPDFLSAYYVAQFISRKYGFIVYFESVDVELFQPSEGEDADAHHQLV